MDRSWRLDFLKIGFDAITGLDCVDLSFGECTKWVVVMTLHSVDANNFLILSEVIHSECLVNDV